MPEVELFTKMTRFDGPDDPDDFIARVIIPQMSPPPDVVHWNNRFFVRHDEDEYTEAVVWMATELSANQDP